MNRLPKQNYTREFKQEAIWRVVVEGKRQAEVPSEFRILSEPGYAASFCSVSQTS